MIFLGGRAGGTGDGTAVHRKTDGYLRRVAPVETENDNDRALAYVEQLRREGGQRIRTNAQGRRSLEYLKTIQYDGKPLTFPVWRDLETGDESLIPANCPQ